MYCNNCGKEIKDGNAFCTNCGMKIADHVHSTELNDSNKKKINFKIIYILIPIIILVVSICLVVIILNNKRQAEEEKNDIVNNTVINNSENEGNKNDVEESIEQENGETSENGENKENSEDEKSLKESNEQENLNTNSEVDFISEINSKYPNMQDKICYNNYGEYWLLDKQGKKVYFHDMASFETALKECNKDSTNTVNNNNIGSSSEKENNNNNTNTNTNTNAGNTSQNRKTNNTIDEATKRLISFSEGFKVEDYTSDLNNWGIKYKIVYGQNYDYDDGYVYKIEPNHCYVDKNSTVTLTVADNTYNMEVMIDPYYLLDLAGIANDESKYTSFYDSKQGKYVGTKIKLNLKINGNTIFNGETETVKLYENPKVLGTIKGKKKDNYNIEVIIEGVKINKKIEYSIECDRNSQMFYICEEYRNKGLG